MASDARPLTAPGLDAVELRHLRYFLAVADARSFTRAAEDLHLAQQALSASIARLEVQLGVRLFDRSTRRIALTPAGEVLAEEARKVVAAAQHALDRVRLVAEGRAGRLVVGFSTAAGGLEIVRDILRAHARAAPEVDLQTLEHDFADPSAGLLAGRTQAAFIFGPLPGPGLEALELLREDRLVAVAEDHPLAGAGAVGPSDLDVLPWLQVPAPDGPWPSFWFPTRPGAGPVIRTADEWVTAIEAGRGAAFTLPSVMRNFTTARVATVPVTGLPPASVLLAWQFDDEDPLVRALLATAEAVITRA